MSEIKNNKEVIKSSAAIQISNKVSLLQRRCWNVLLANAYNDLLKKDKYTIDVVELMDFLGFDSKNLQYLKTSLRAIRKQEVEWNVLGKDKKEEWGVSGLLADVQISNGILTYSYGGILKEKLYEPAMYAKINLYIQNLFKSKYTLALYETFLDYFDEKRQEGETPFIDIKTLRKLLGLEENEYVEFKVLSRDIIKKSISEINKKSNFKISVKYKKEIRSVIAIKFIISKKVELGGDNIELELREKFLLSKIQISKVLIKYTDMSLLKSILNEIEKKYQRKGIKNLGAYTFKVLENHSGIIKSSIDIEKVKKKQLTLIEIEESKGVVLNGKETNKDICQNFIESITMEELLKIKDDFYLKEVKDSFLSNFWEKGDIDNPGISASFRTYILKNYVDR